MWGQRRAVLISTHSDKQHIHNHFAVSVFDNEGKRWYANKRSLKKCREVSDALAKEYGISFLDPKCEKRNYNYAEWLARKNRTSWKIKIADELDRLVYDENVKNLEDLMSKLAARGYGVSYGKHLTIRPSSAKHGVRSYRLGDGYSVDALIYRIEHRDKIMTAAEIENYTGIQREYAVCLLEIQLSFMRRSDTAPKPTFTELTRNSELLCFHVNNNIHSEENFKAFVNEAEEKYRKAEERRRIILEKIEFEKKLLAQYPAFIALWKKEKLTPKESDELGKYQVLIDYKMYDAGKVQEHKDKLDSLEKELSYAEKDVESLKSERNTASENYKHYVWLMENDFGMILERKYKERERRATQLNSCDKKLMHNRNERSADQNDRYSR